RFGTASPPAPDIPGAHAGSPWAAALATVAPVLGPLSEAERRRQTLGKSLVGRELELKALRDGFAESIRARENRSMLIVGEPGLGKRSLIDRFVAGLPASSCAVLQGAGRWSARNRPLGVFLDVIERFLRIDR